MDKTQLVNFYDDDGVLISAIKRKFGRDHADVYCTLEFYKDAVVLKSWPQEMPGLILDSSDFAEYNVDRPVLLYLRKCDFAAPSKIEDVAGERVLRGRVTRNQHGSDCLTLNEVDFVVICEEMSDGFLLDDVPI